MQGDLRAEKTRDNQMVVPTARKRDSTRIVLHIAGRTGPLCKWFFGNILTGVKPFHRFLKLHYPVPNLSISRAASATCLPSLFPSYRTSQIVPANTVLHLTFNLSCSHLSIHLNPLLASHSGQVIRHSLPQLLQHWSRPLEETCSNRQSAVTVSPLLEDNLQ